MTITMPEWFLWAFLVLLIVKIPLDIMSIYLRWKLRKLKKVTDVYIRAMPEDPTP